MKYKQKLWLNKNQYLAILENAIVIVTLDDNGNEIKYVIFEKRGVNVYETIKK